MSENNDLFIPEERLMMEKNIEYCKVNAIVSCAALEKVEQRLWELGVPGITVAHVMGYGEYADYFSQDRMTRHARIEIFTDTKTVERIVQAIMDAAHSGAAGDGIVAVLPVSHLYRIRSRSEMMPDAL
ncbi:MAG: P-II family nitrogen regulator [Gallionella sp.]|nr:P-II family nitrogen regulator [Gallionella sp.]